MNRPSPVRDTRLLWLILVVGCFTGLTILWTGYAANAGPSSAPLQVGMAAPPANVQPSQYVVGIKCTLSVTNDQDFTGQGLTTGWAQESSFPALASYSGLVLSFGDVPTSSVQADAFDEYFRLDNAAVGASYKVEAIPDYTSNYNLGIIVYDQGPTFTPIMSDVNAQDNNTASVTFNVTGSGPYYFRVVQLTPGCTGLTYRLRVTFNPATATPTPTPSTTPTPTSTAQPWTQPDSYEPNNDKDHAAVPGSSSVTGLTLYNTAYPNPSDDEDWFLVYGTAGYQYSVNAAPDTGYVYPYLFLEVIGPDRTSLVGQVPSSNNATVSWTAGNTGAYFIHIKRATGSPTNGTYKLSWSTNAPTATPTPGPGEPTDTPVPGLDAFEPNYDFDHAAGIGLNVKYTNINFVPLPGQTINNDFFKIRVKRGMLVTCETLDLSPGTDTNIILYDDNRQGLAGNDDVDKLHGDLRSRATVSINFDGFLYILVGQGYEVPPSQAINYNYSLQCTSGAGQASATPTPTQAPVVVPPTELPPTLPPASAAPPSPPPTLMPPISVRPIATPTPPGPVQQIVTADLRVSLDVNGNGVADPGEGIVGLPVRVYDDVTGVLLAQGFTDDSGGAILSVPSAGAIRVVVPYLGFGTTVQPGGATIPVLISPRDLPDQIP